MLLGRVGGSRRTGRVPRRVPLSCPAPATANAPGVWVLTLRGRAGPGGRPAPRTAPPRLAGVSRSVSAPRIPPALRPLDLGAGGLHDELELRAVRVTGAAGDALAVRHLELTGALLEDADLGGARLTQLALRDCRLSGGSLANAAVRGGIAQRSAFERVRLTGLSWHEGTLRDVSFRGCRIDLASFAASRLERVRFEDCSLAESELQDARLAAVVFEDCDLTGLDLSGARLTAGCVLRGCTLDGIRGVERLRGATMPLSDVIAAAGVLASALGIRIEEDDEHEQRG